MCLQKRIDQRLEKCNSIRPSSIKVNLINFIEQKNVIWLGGSEFSNKDNFKYFIHTREEY